jgi:hypothetical protein
VDKIYNKFLQLLTPLALLCLLSGCNLVVSKEPWFAEADTAGAPRFRDGLWTSTKSNDCKFDSVSDPSTWPDCAANLRVKDNRWSSLERDQDAEGDEKSSVWKDFETVVVGGDPAIVQYKTSPEGIWNPSEQYVYLAVRPTQSDAQGNVVAFSAWAVFCGPVEQGQKKQTEASMVTSKPFEGLKMVDYNCLAKDTGAVRNAALQSEKLVVNGRQQLGLVRWVRD